MVDDDKSISELVVMRLKEEGFESEAIGDGYEALNAIRQKKPDLILLDVMLPKMDGYEICRLIKFDRHYQDIPVILSTSLAGAETQKMGAEVGANAFLPKPYVMEDLLATIRKLLNTKR